VCLQEWFEPGRITAPGFVIGTVGWGLCIGSGPEGGAPGQMQASIAFPRFESIDAPINLVLPCAKRADVCSEWVKKVRAVCGIGMLRRCMQGKAHPDDRFRGGAEHVCCRPCYGPVRGAAGFAFSQPVQIDDEGSL
jgi:hypothetical protein